jgi:hypothetical protein
LGLAEQPAVSAVVAARTRLLLPAAKQLAELWRLMRVLQRKAEPLWAA